MRVVEEYINLPANVSSGVLRKKVWSLAWPSIAESCLLLAIGLSDAFLLGHLSPEASAKLGYDNAAALAGASAGQFFNWSVNSIWMSIGIATTALVARSIGTGDRPRASIFARQSLIVSILAGMVFCLVALFLGREFLNLLGAEGNLANLGFLYLGTTAFGLPMNALLVAGNGSLRGSGDTRTPLFIMGCVNVVNIGVAWLLINGAFGLPVLGIRGAAIGAISGWSVGAFMVTTRLLGLWPGDRKYLNALRIKFSLRLKLPDLQELVQIGLPTLGEQMVFQIGLIFFARFIVSLGTVTYAGFSAIINIDSASFLPGLGIATAGTVLVGQSLGGGRPDLAERYAKTAWAMGLVFMGSMGLLFFSVPEFFLRLLVDNQAVIDEAAWPLRIAGLFDPFLATSFVLIGVLRGAGDTTWPLYSRLLGTWLIRVCLGAIFIPVLGFGLVGGRIAMGIDSVAVAFFVYYRFRSGRWKDVWAEKKAAKARKAGTISLAVSSASPMNED